MRLGIEFAEMRRTKDGLYEVPILRETQILDRGLTSGGGKGGQKIDAAMLREIAGNFSKWPLPVSVSAGEHKSIVQRGNEAAAAFVESVFVDGQALWARIKVNAENLRAELDADGWRGFSVEIVKDFKLPTVAMAGWALRGGVFTNAPATPTLFKQLAASLGSEGSDEDETRAFAHSELRPQRPNTKEREMSAEKVAQLEATIAEQKKATADLTAKLDKATKALEAATAKKPEDKPKPETKNDSERVTALEATVKDLAEQLVAAGRTNAGERAKALRDKAVGEFNIKPALFEGLDDDPGKWADENKAVMEGLEAAMAKGLEPTEKQDPISSGADKSGGDAGKKLDAAIEAVRKTDPKLDYTAALEHVRATSPAVFQAAMEAEYAVQE